MGPLTDKNTDSRAKCTQWGKIQVNQFRFRHPWKKQNPQALKNNGWTMALFGTWKGKRERCARQRKHSRMNEYRQST